jgi:hypothetical protein
VQLNWQYNQAGDYFFIIYRAADNEPLQRLQSIAKDNLRFNDINTTTGKKYHYAIQAIHKDGKGNTRLGEPVEVNR